MLSEIGRIIKGFFRWWITELRSLVPANLLRGFVGRRETLRLRYAGEALTVERERGAELLELGQIPISADMEQKMPDEIGNLLKRHRVRPGPADLVLSGGLALNREVELPIEVAENLAEVLAFEMDRLTPFRADEIYYDYAVKGSDPELKHLIVGLLIARRADIDRLADWARKAGLEPRSAGGGREEDARVERGEGSFDLLPRETPNARGVWLTRATVLLVVITLLLSGGALYASMARDRRALDLAEEKVADLRAVAAEMKTLEERAEQLRQKRNFVLEEKRDRPVSLAILDEVTRRIPDGSWLLRFIVKDGELRIIGFAGEPSRLVRNLEESPMLSSVRFAAPVTRDPRLQMDRFNLTAKIGSEAVSEGGTE